MLVIALITVLAVLVFAIGQPHDDDQPAFHPAYLALTAGVSLSFVTGDLFNLFVSFEMHAGRQLRAHHAGRPPRPGPPRA